MRYYVSEEFYEAVSALVEIATEHQSEVEFDLAMRVITDLVVDTPEARKYYGERTK